MSKTPKVDFTKLLKTPVWDDCMETARSWSSKHGDLNSVMKRCREEGLPAPYMARGLLDQWVQLRFVSKVGRDDVVLDVDFKHGTWTWTRWVHAAGTRGYMSGSWGVPSFKDAIAEMRGGGKQ